MSLASTPEKRAAMHADPSDPRHGTTTGYGGWGCRCRPCTRANAHYQRVRTWERRTEPIPDHVHGTENGYANYGCSCDVCLDHMRPIWREREDRRKTA